jgi:hypothetical protein
MVEYHRDYHSPPSEVGTSFRPRTARLHYCGIALLLDLFHEKLVIT